MRIIREAETVINDEGKVRRLPKIGICCKWEITLDRFTNTCDECGSDYDRNGSLLAPRSQWGEETGEAWFDFIGE